MKLSINQISKSYGTNKALSDFTAELTAKIEGKVWSVPCAETDVAALQQKFRVISINRDEQTGQVLLRVLAEEAPTPNSKTAAPTLEDYYLYVFGEEI